VPPAVSHEAADFCPVQVSSLLIDVAVDFDLYIATGASGHLLFRGRDLEFTEPQRDRLMARDVRTLYIRRDDRKQYCSYLQRRIGDILADASVETGTKAELLYTVSQDVLEEVFQTPRSGQLLEKAENVSTQTLRFLIGREPDEALHSLIRMMSNDYSTLTHSMNVCVFALALAQRAGVRQFTELREFAAGVLLHDIGKSEIPGEILKKTGPLSQDEMTVMKRHVELGERILAEVGVTNRSRLLPVSLHHERMNGEGYPRGLTREDLHLYGRIAAIADCFDAMTTNRTYQSAHEASDALALMKGRMCTQFDQSLLDTFIRIVGGVRG
jgi:HD-GYP domain-containing protein (c-di-GMP phosphodiesterase class II)